MLRGLMGVRMVLSVGCCLALLLLVCMLDGKLCSLAINHCPVAAYPCPVSPAVALPQSMCTA